MNLQETSGIRDRTADDVTRGLSSWAETPLITRAACIAIFIIAVAEERGVSDVVRLFLL